MQALAGGAQSLSLALTLALAWPLSKYRIVWGYVAVK